MKRHILMLGPLPRPQMLALQEKYQVHLLWKVEDPELLLQEVKDDVTAVVATAWNKVSEKLINALEKLEIIANFGVGFDNIDIEAARMRGIPVTNTPDVLTDDVADFAMGLILAVNRRLVEGDIYARSGRWAENGMLPLGRSLGGKTMGILGFGRIGRAIAERALPFGLRIIYSGPHKKENVVYDYYADLASMAAEADFLMVSCVSNEQTYHLVDKAVLQALGVEGVVINISRGHVIDEASLVQALVEGDLRGAGLDVFEKEPYIPEALRSMDNVVLQPHQASATVETREAMGQLVVDNLNCYFDHAELLTPVLKSKI